MLAGAVLLLTLPLLGIHVARNHYHCLSCGSDRTVNQWRWGAYWPEESRKLSDPWDTVTPSRFFGDYLAGRHSHGEQGWMRSGTYLLGIRKSSRMSYGEWSPKWLDAYETEDDFRRWLGGQVRDGKISLQALTEAASPVSRQPPGYSDYPDPEGKGKNIGDRWHSEYESSQKR